MKKTHDKPEVKAFRGPAPEAATETKKLMRTVTLPADPAGQKQGIKNAFINTAAALVFAKQMQPFVKADRDENNRWGAELFIQAIRESVQPRDALEEMLMVQMAWTHARLARLSSIACDQELRRNVQVVHDACDRAANTFRRQMMTLAEYRRPAQQGSFVAVRQANIANQQVVQNVESPNAITSNEQGSAPAALSPVAQRFELPAGNSDAKQAVAAEHWPQDGDGQGPIQTERHQARRAKRTKPGGLAGAKRGPTGGEPQ